MISKVFCCVLHGFWGWTQVRFHWLKFATPPRGLRVVRGFLDDFCVASMISKVFPKAAMIFLMAVAC